MTGKYNSGIPKGSRLDRFKGRKGLRKNIEESGGMTEETLEKVLKSEEYLFSEKQYKNRTVNKNITQRSEYND